MFDRVLNTPLSPSFVPVLHEQFQIIYKKSETVFGVRIWSLSSLYYPAFGLNTHIYFVNLCI